MKYANSGQVSVEIKAGRKRQLLPVKAYRPKSVSFRSPIKKAAGPHCKKCPAAFFYFFCKGKKRPHSQSGNRPGNRSAWFQRFCTTAYMDVQRISFQQCHFKRMARHFHLKLTVLVGKAK